MMKLSTVQKLIVMADRGTEGEANNAKAILMREALKVEAADRLKARILKAYGV